MTVSQQDILDATALAIGRNPLWIDDAGDPMEVATTAATAAPTSGASGFATNGALMAFVAVDLHVQPGIPRAICVPSEISNSSAYRVDVDGQDASYTSDGSATRAEITAGLKAAIDALAISGVSTTDEDIDGDELSDVVVRSTDNRRHLVEAVTRMTVTMEASYCRFRIWAKPYDSDQWRTVTPLPDQSWRVSRDGSIEVHSNAIAAVRVAGYERIAVQVLAVDGAMTWRFGICEAE